MKPNTNWSSPKTNMFAGLLSLRAALAAGENAVLIRMRNEDCAFPLQYKEDPEKVNFRGYKFTIGYQSTYNQILNDNSSPYNKYLSLNFKSVYGTDEAIKKYYETGVLTKDNLMSAGRNHLVKVDDLIEYYSKQPDAWSKQHAAELTLTYRTPETRDTRAWFDFFTKEHGNEWQVRKFKHKLWVVSLLDKKQPISKLPMVITIMNMIFSPVYFLMKWIPRKDILDMKVYKLVTYRVGGITTGFSVQFHIPRKFGW